MEKGDSVIRIEWADKMGSRIPENRMDVKFEYLDNTSRKIEINE